MLSHPVASIVASLGKLSLLWLKKDYFYRRKAIERLKKESHFSEKMAEVLVDSIFKELTAEKLTQLLRAELRNPEALDGFKRDALTKKLVRARGPRRILHIFAGNVPNPAILSFIFGMLLKSVNVGKVSGKDRGFLDIYLESLKTVNPQLAETNSLIKSRDKNLVKKWMKKADLVVAFGSDETLGELRKEIPASIPLVGYGHRVSYGLYTKEALTRRKGESLAKKTALDIWSVDQRGCLSPLVIYVEKGGEISPAFFASLLAKQLERLSRGETLESSLSRIVHQEGVKHYYKIQRIKGSPAQLWESSHKGRWTVFYDEKISGTSHFSGHQVVTVRTFKKLGEVYQALSPLAKNLQAIALEAGPLRRKMIAEALSALGANRICRAGQMQFPPLTWHHDGRPNLASWVTWADLEL